METSTIQALVSRGHSTAGFACMGVGLGKKDRYLFAVGLGIAALGKLGEIVFLLSAHAATGAP